MVFGVQREAYAQEGRCDDGKKARAERCADGWRLYISRLDGFPTSDQYFVLNFTNAGVFVHLLGTVGADDRLTPALCFR